MGKLFDKIDTKLRSWMAKQPMFFVGTAPLQREGHVNISPKGPIGSFRVLGESTVAYLDLIGSGAETIAHLRENGRIVVMFCAFDGPPRIVRLHGRGRAVSQFDGAFEQIATRCRFPNFSLPEARRAVIVVEVDRISDSCGYGVPLMSYEGRRSQMEAWCDKKLRAGGGEALVAYQREKNARSIDGLPAVEIPRGPRAAQAPVTRRTTVAPAAREGAKTRARPKR
jgi:hypothetical protein